MAYIRKVLSQDEKMIGIARLHWIYVVKGLFWFVVLAGAGWVLDWAVSKAVFAVSSATGARGLPGALMTISSSAMYFMMFGGFMIFLLFVIKVLVTEVGLTSRRVIEKTGLIFVKVRQVDVEEIRGENLDLGHLGRILGYGYLMLDCRFVGDVKLPAIENPERFLRALHSARGKSQDAVSVVRGKSGSVAPLDFLEPEAQQQPELPQPAAPTPTPEIQPGQLPQPEINPPRQPEVPLQPVPHAPPAPQQPPSQPEQPSTPAQLTPAPPPSEPPLQPPTSLGQGAKHRGNAVMNDLRQEISEGISHAHPIPMDGEPPQSANAAPAAISVPAQVAQTPPLAAPVQNPQIDAKMVAEVVKQVMPQMAQQVAQQLVDQGMIDKKSAKDDTPDGKEDLIASFDDAALDKDGNPRPANVQEHRIH